MQTANVVFALTLLVAAIVGPARIWRELVRQVPGFGTTRGRDVIAILVLVAITVSSYRAMALGIPPSTQDHNFHMIKVIQTENLLRHGHLTGWSDLELAGHPHNVLYPFAHTLVVAALNLFVGFERAYAWTMLLVALLTTLGVWFVARLHFSQPVAFVAGWMALYDPGGWGVGGWSFTMETGVWPSAVALVLAIVSLALVPRAVGIGTLRGSLAPGICLGIAILFHPSAVLVTAFASPFLVFALVTADNGDPAVDLRRIAFAGGRIVLVAMAIAAFWFVPFASQSRHTFHAPHVAPWSKDLWSAFIDGRVFRQPGLYEGAAICGFFMIARRRTAFARLMIVFVPFVLAFVTIDSLELFHLLKEEPHPWISRLQPERVIYLARVFAMIASAYALVHLGAGARVFFTARGWRAPALRIAVGASIALAVALPGSRIPGMVSTPVGLRKDERPQLEHALDAAVPLLGDGGRLALVSEPGDHTMVGPAGERNVRIEKIGTSASMFVTQFHALDINRMWDLEMLRRSGTRAVISRGGLPGWFGTSWPLVGTFGPFEVHSMTPLSRAWMQGPGSVRVVSWADERIELEVSGASDTSRVRLFLGYYDAWHVEGGDEVERWDWQEQRLAELPAKNGRIVLVYRRKLVERASLVLSIALAVLVLILLKRERAATTPPRPEPPRADELEGPPEPVTSS